MRKIYIIANWKSFKTTKEAITWFEAMAKLQQNPLQEKIVVICPPFTLLPVVKDCIQQYNLPFAIGSQNISPFEQGAYTGEINAAQVADFGTYTILGHSERRKNFGEDDSLLTTKAALAKKYSLTPIFCVPDKNTAIAKDAVLVAYEPVAAIGSGNPDTPENANAVASFIKQQNPQVQFVLYGGSVTPDNVASFTNCSHIDGVLVGGASLDPLKFSQIIAHV